LLATAAGVDGTDTSSFPTHEHDTLDFDGVFDFLRRKLDRVLFRLDVSRFEVAGLGITFGVGSVRKIADDREVQPAGIIMKVKTPGELLVWHAGCVEWGLVLLDS
jgi:hypothetical protein